jgi:hypothetical protein
MSLPTPYDALPLELQETLVRSHFEAEKGWKGLSLEEYLKMRNDEGTLDVIKAVYERCRAIPSLWAHIDSIVGPWTYAAGHDISQGFAFKCAKPEALLDLLKASSKFCRDGVNCHGPRDTFRELIKSGPGLHVCVTQSASRSSHLHDMHIDKFQTVCTKKSDGYCDYAYLDSNMYNHMKDVVPWWVGERMKELGKIIAEHPPERGPKY